MRTKKHRTIAHISKWSGKKYKGIKCPCKYKTITTTKKGGRGVSITSSGPICDVCGNYILPLKHLFGLKPEEKMISFKISGIDQMLHCDEKCEPILQKALKEKDWKLLPKGPLKKAFQEQVKL